MAFILFYCIDLHYFCIGIFFRKRKLYFINLSFRILQEPIFTVSSNIPIEIFWRILDRLCPSEGFSRYDVEAIIVSLLDQGYIKGYISSERKIIVFKKGGPFPTPYEVSNRLLE
jgi:hypothetical protein